MTPPFVRIIRTTTVAILRAMTNRPPLLPCSPVAFLDADGRRMRVREVQTRTPRDEQGKPTGVPVAVVILEPEEGP